MTPNRMQLDGTTFKGWQLVKTDGSTPSEGDWSGATQVYNTTGFRTRGGRLGFLAPHSGNNLLVGNVTIKSF